MNILSIILAFGLFLFSDAGQVTYDFNITWLSANPDGAFERPVIGINGQWPIPIMTATVGDNIIVNVNNQLGNQSTSLHFHGLYQNGTTHMDGAAGVSQCAIPPGGSFTYNFTINQPGTYWYHSHVSPQYPDGLRGPLVISDPDSPYKGKYDQEFVLTLSDWYHDQMTDLMKIFLNVANPTGAEPVPDAALMNDTQNLTTPVQPGKTYMFRIINVGAFAGMYFWFEGHQMQIVEVDGVYTQSAPADMIYLTAAQRCSVLVTTKNDTSANFPFVTSMDTDLFDTVPPTLNTNATGWLVYNDKNNNPDPALLDDFEPFDDFKLVPYDQQPLLDKVDYSFPLVVQMNDLSDGANYAFFNNITYVSPNVPTLYSAISTGSSANDSFIYGSHTNSFILEQGHVVEIVLNNNDPGKHPFHLHGHAFQAVVRSDDSAGDYVGNETFPASPMRRDTFMVRPNGNIVLRFRADNPGIWLFHCHIEWHVSSGLLATMVEAPLALQDLQVPESHFDTCKAQNKPFKGNAAGNTVDLFDLDGENAPPPELPDGFTPRGIVALTFSIIAAFAGMAMISWYGVGEIGKREPGKYVKETVAEGEGDGNGVAN